MRALASASLLLACTGSPSPADASPTADTEAVLRQLEDRWANAYVAHDAVALEPVLAEEFVMSRANNAVWTKADYLAHVRNDTRQHMSITRADERYQLYGDAAVVTYRPTRLTAGVPYTFRSTDTFIRRHGRWQLVARHITEIPRQASPGGE